jgi:hypothetical protein
MSRVIPEWIYDNAVRVLFKCPDVPAHAHITMDTLWGMVEDREAFRAAVAGVVRDWEDSECERFYDGRDSGYLEGYEAGRESGLWAASQGDG